MSNMLRAQPTNPKQQRGALMLVTLVILLIITLLGMATVDTTGLEMQMSSNSRQQQATFEAAEYTLSWVENELQTNGYFSDNQLNNTSCGSVCFSNACTNGYCFYGSNPNTFLCTLTVPTTTEPYADGALWANSSGKHQTLTVPDSGLTAKYIIEYWCYTAKDLSLPFDDSNKAHVYRITALATSADGRVRTMLRSVIRQPE
jgi:type IV pilus assembly protein PilX